MSFRRVIAEKWTSNICRKRLLFGRAALDAVAMKMGRRADQAGKMINDRITKAPVRVMAKNLANWWNVRVIIYEWHDEEFRVLDTKPEKPIAGESQVMVLITDGSYWWGLCPKTRAKMEITKQQWKNIQEKGIIVCSNYVSENLQAEVDLVAKGTTEILDIDMLLKDTKVDENGEVHKDMDYGAEDQNQTGEVNDMTDDDNDPDEDMPATEDVPDGDSEQDAMFESETQQRGFNDEDSEPESLESRLPEFDSHTGFSSATLSSSDDEHEAAESEVTRRKREGFESVRNDRIRSTDRVRSRSRASSTCKVDLPRHGTKRTRDIYSDSDEESLTAVKRKYVERLAALERYLSKRDRDTDKIGKKIAKSNKSVCMSVESGSSDDQDRRSCIQPIRRGQNSRSLVIASSKADPPILRSVDKKVIQEWATNYKETLKHGNYLHPRDAIEDHIWIMLETIWNSEAKEHSFSDAAKSYHKLSVLDWLNRLVRVMSYHEGCEGVEGTQVPTIILKVDVNNTPKYKDYCVDFSKVWTENPDITDKDLAHHFREGLKAIPALYAQIPTWIEKLRKHNKKTWFQKLLQQVMKNLTKLELYKVDGTSRYNGTRKGDSQHRNDGGFNRSRQPDMSKKCDRCGAYGHVADECRNSQKRCHICGISGHLAKYCRKNQRQNNSRYSQQGNYNNTRYQNKTNNYSTNNNNQNNINNNANNDNQSSTKVGGQSNLYSVNNINSSNSTPYEQGAKRQRYSK